jgi:hypothetical protein
MARGCDAAAPLADGSERMASLIGGHLELIDVAQNVCAAPANAAADLDGEECCLIAQIPNRAGAYAEEFGDLIDVEKFGSFRETCRLLGGRHKASP